MIDSTIGLMSFDILIAVFESRNEQDYEQWNENEARRDCRELWEKLEDVDEKEEPRGKKYD